MVLMANRYILPAAYRYQGQLARASRRSRPPAPTAKETQQRLDEVIAAHRRGQERASTSCRTLLEHEANGDAEKHAKYFRDKVVPAMAALREAGDTLEGLVPHDVWPLPTYREMLFVK